VKTKSTSTAKPTYPGLAIDVDCELQPDVARERDEVHRDGVEWQGQYAEVHDSYRALGDGANDATLGDIKGSGRKLAALLVALVSSLVALRWRRFGLLPRIIPDMQRHVHKLAAEYEQAVQDAMDKAGQDALHGMPAGDSEAGRFQLRRIVEQELPCLAAKGRLAQAQSQLDSLRAAAVTPPNSKYCVISRPPTGNDLVDMILDRTAPPIPRPVYSSAFQQIREQNGLGAAELMPEHVETIQAIVDEMGIPVGGTGYRIKFRALRQSLVKKIGPLLERLPATADRNKCLADLRDYQVSDASVGSNERHVAGTVSPTDEPQFRAERKTYYPDQPPVIV
jgi:hypothetical protein